GAPDEADEADGSETADGSEGPAEPRPAPGAAGSPARRPRAASHATTSPAPRPSAMPTRSTAVSMPRTYERGTTVWGWTGVTPACTGCWGPPRPGPRSAP